jgi:hypothetical protein
MNSKSKTSLEAVRICDPRTDIELAGLEPCRSLDYLSFRVHGGLSDEFDAVSSRRAFVLGIEAVNCLRSKTRTSRCVMQCSTDR